MDSRPSLNQFSGGLGNLTFPLLADFWPHGAVSQAYGVFNADAGYPNRGTVAADRAGIVRFADCRQPGEGRDAAVWAAALAALQA